MDLMLALLIILAGVIPPVATGYWAYRMGKKGSNEAIALRDEALGQVKALKADLLALEERLIKALPSMPEIPEPDYEAIADDVKSAVLKSLDGYMGSVKKDLNEMSSKIDKALTMTGDRPAGGGDSDIVFKLMNKFL